MDREDSLTTTPKMIHVEPGSELDRLLQEAAETTVEFEQRGVRYRITRVSEPGGRPSLHSADEHDIWAGYDPEKARAGMHAAAGSWRDIDTDTLKADLYRARDEGSRPLERP